ncbi:MAG: type I restriction enzyme HsdR N-terminal domain-containing protein [Fibrobacter sp.]|nr:type I restriction enzyme HsdR N-terminal domain-containing protein [Fibrobacter sp.]MBR6449692.1 type I restriction enzyme HsdR N-terminal domain-containing protein [Fibrobacter sp.]
MWGFRYGIGEQGSFREQVELQVGRGTNIRPDFVLYCAGDKKVVIEAKAPSEAVGDQKNVDQLDSYVKQMNASAGILINGKEICLYLTDKNGAIDRPPFRSISLEDATDEELVFIVKMFDVEHVFADGQMKREAAKAKSERENSDRMEKFTRLWIEKFLVKPSNEDIKCVVREIEGVTVVSQNKVDTYRNEVLPGAMQKVKAAIVNDAVKKHDRDNNEKNHLQPQEFAVGKLVEWFIEQKSGKAEFRDDENAAEKSVVVRSDCGKTILWIIGSVDRENGYSFTGVAFPNKAKGKGKVIRLDDPVDVLRKHSSRLLWVYESINDSSKWSAGYDSMFSVV